MAQPTVRFCLCLLIMFLAIVAAVAVPDKPKKAKKCHDKVNYPDCFNAKDIYCPADCPRDCYVECSSCQPVCSQAPILPPLFSSPPPPKTESPPSPPPSSPPPPTPVSPPNSPRPPPPARTPPSSPTPPPKSTPPAWNPPPSPTSSSSAPKRAKCNNRAHATCYGVYQPCPSTCPHHCEVDCVTCRPVCNCDRPGTVCQDPRFIGGDGITFYFHGKKDRDFCIVSDSNLHINAHFIGRRNENLQRDFTWVQSLGILFDTHKLFIGAKRTKTWDDSVDHLLLAFDGEPVYLPDGEGTKWQPEISSNVTIVRSHDTNSIAIEVEDKFKIKATVVPITEKDSRIHNYGITSENCFAHLDLSFKFYALSGDVNGVLGQTYASNYVSRIRMGAVMPVLGGEREFASSSLFATDCAAARFSGQQARSNSLANFEHTNLECASEMDGRGVVCKR